MKKVLEVRIEVQSDSYDALQRGDAPKFVLSVIGRALERIIGPTGATLLGAHWEGEPYVPYDAPRNEIKAPRSDDAATNEPSGHSGGLPLGGM
jgi:hypothetical protein